MAESLGDAVLELTADATKLIRAMGDAESDVNKRMKSMGASMQKFGGALTKSVTLPLVGLGTVGVLRLGALNKKLREVNTLTGKTGAAAEADFKKWKDGIRALSDQASITQEELTSGLYDTLSAGIPEENAFTFLNQAAKLGVAGVTDTATAVDGLSTVINAYNLEASDAGRVSDVIFAAMKGGKQTVEEMAGSLFNVAGEAEAMGVNFEQTAAAMATLTKRGAPASVATTRLRAVMTALMRPTSDLKDAFQELGVDGWDQLIERKGDMQSALAAIADSADGDKEALNAMFGSTEAVSAVLSLTGKNAKSAAKDLDDIEASAGATAKGFDEMQKGRAMDALKVSLDNLAISIGEELLPAVIPMVEKITELTGKFGKLSPRMRKIIVIGAAVAAAIGPVIVVIGTLISALSVIMPIIGAVVGVLGLLVSLPVLIGIAIAALVILIIVKWDFIKAKTIQVFTFLVGFLKKWGVTILSVIGGPIAIVVVQIIKNWSKIKAVTRATWNAIKSTIKSVLNSIKQTVRNAFDTIRDTIKNILNGLKTFISAVFNTYVTIIRSIVSKFLAAGRAVGQGIKDGIMAVVKTIGSALKGALLNQIKLIKGIVGAVKGFAVDIGKAMVNGILKGINDIAGKIKDKLTDIVTAAIDAAKGALSIFSPSRVLMDEIGRPMAEGIAAGIDSGAASVARALGNATALPTAMALQSLPGTAGGNGGGPAIGEVNFDIQNPDVDVPNLLAQVNWQAKQIGAFR